MRNTSYTFTTREAKEFIKKWYYKIRTIVIVWYPSVKKFVLYHLKELVITIVALFILALLKGCLG